MDLLDLVGVVSLLLIRWCILYTFTLGISPRLLAMVFERFMPLLFETIRIDSLGRLILVLEVQELIGLSAEFVRNQALTGICIGMLDIGTCIMNLHFYVLLQMQLLWSTSTDSTLVISKLDTRLRMSLGLEVLVRLIAYIKARSLSRSLSKVEELLLRRWGLVDFLGFGRGGEIELRFLAILHKVLRAGCCWFFDSDWINRLVRMVLIKVRLDKINWAAFAIHYELFEHFDNQFLLLRSKTFLRLVFGDVRIDWEKTVIQLFESGLEIYRFLNRSFRHLGVLIQSI